MPGQALRFPVFIPTKHPNDLWALGVPSPLGVGFNPGGGGRISSRPAELGELKTTFFQFTNFRWPEEFFLPHTHTLFESCTCGNPYGPKWLRSGYISPCSSTAADASSANSAPRSSKVYSEMEYLLRCRLVPAAMSPPGLGDIQTVSASGYTLVTL